MVPLRFWSAFSAFALLAVSLPLWVAPPAREAFPQVPLFEVFCQTPIWIDWLALLGLCLGWVLIAAQSTRLGPLLVVATAVLLVALNQHRLQSWHYQLTVFAALFSINDDQLRRRLMQWFIASIYIYSALSKLDYEFLHTVGVRFVDVGLQWTDGTLSSGTRSQIAWCIPLIELLIGIGVCWHKTRRVAGLAACGMHLLLLAILGPLGLNHSWGVLWWNVHFIGVALLLFVLPAKEISRETAAGPDAKESPRESRRAWLPTALLVPWLFLPLLERLGYWDHWPSWALYAPHSSRVSIEIAASHLELLPPGAQAVTPPVLDETELWIRVPIDEWSIAEVGVPIYPQARFQAGVARSLAGRIQSPFAIRAQVLSTASRLDGRRERSEYVGTEQIERIGREFLFSCKPRASQEVKR